MGRVCGGDGDAAETVMGGGAVVVRTETETATERGEERGAVVVGVGVSSLRGGG